MGGWRRDGWLALDFRFWSSLFLFIHLMEKNAVISYLDSLGFFFLSLCLIRAGDLCLYIQSRSWIYSAYLPLSDVGGSRDSQSDFFCVFWISRHPRTSYRIKSVYSLMLQTIVERSSFFSFLFFGCMCLLKTRWWQWWSDEQGPIYCGLYSRLQYIRVFVFTVGTLMGELYYTDLPSLDDRRLTVPSVPCFLLKWTSSLNRGRGLSVSASTLSPSLPFKMQLTNQSSSPFYVRHTATVCFTIALFVEPEINPASRGHPVPKFPLVDSSISVVFSMRNSPTRPNSTIFYLSECCCFNM